MTALFFWCLWSFIASIGIKYTSMQLLNVDLKLLNAFLILLVYQWIRFVKPLSKKELKEKPKKEPKEPSALDILIKIKSNKIKTLKKNYVLEIQKFIDEINEYMSNNAIENTHEEIFFDLESQKNKEFNI